MSSAATFADRRQDGATEGHGLSCIFHGFIQIYRALGFGGCPITTPLASVETVSNKGVEGA